MRPRGIRRPLILALALCFLALFLLVFRMPGAAAAVRPALLVLSKTANELAVVDPATLKVVGRAPTGNGPHEVAVSADGRTAFVSNYGAQTPGSTISVIDLASLKEVRRADLAPLLRPHGIMVADAKVYFTAEANRLVARYDPASNRVDWLFGTGQAGTHMVFVSEDGAKLVTTNIGSDSITIMERGTNPLAWNQVVVPVGKGPEGFDLSPDGRTLWAAHSRDGGVSVIDLATRKVVHTIDA